MRRIRIMLAGLGVVVVLGGCAGNGGTPAQTTTPPTNMNQPSGAEAEGESENEPQAEWATYSNARFGFTLDYPASWHADGESDNGDGIRLTDGDEAVVSAYASHYDEALAPNLSDSVPTTLDNDRDANLFVTDEAHETHLRVVFILDDRIQYNLDFKLSTAYYEAHQVEIERVIASLDFFEGLDR
ncbi:hypothetical protein [Paenibacillus sp. 1P07SE]|uniref:hypothetical protein n=1 Tax=Paenibacillus sp. 1P07SE TaxID=3132209 RepID=UPI0039A6D66B